MLHYDARWAVCGLGVLLVTGLPGPADAADTPPVQPKWLAARAEVSASGQAMDAVIAGLQKRYEVSFLMDGAPTVKAANITHAGALSEVLDRVAAAYGYEWRAASDGRVVLLTKTFTVATDRPQAHEAELRGVAKDVTQILRQWNIGSEPEARATAFDRFYQSLDPRMRGALRRGEAISVAEYSPAQQKALRLAMNTNYLCQTAHVWTSFLQQLNGLDRATLCIERTRLGALDVSLDVPSQGGRVLQERIGGQMADAMAAELKADNGFTVSTEKGEKP